MVTINNKKRNQNREKITLDDIRSTYFEEKRKSDRENPWLYFVVRPISFYLTWLFLRLGISANGVTFLGLIIGLGGCVFITIGSYWAAVGGAILVNIAFLFDVIDGNVARCTDSCTKYGEYIDRMASTIVIPMIFISVGIGVFNHPDTCLNFLAHFFFGIDISRNIYILVGLLGAFLTIYGFLVTCNLWAVFSIKPVEFYKPEAEHERSHIIYTLGLGVMTAIWPILLVAAVAKVLSLFLFLWTLIAACYLIVVTTKIKICRDNEKFDNKPNICEEDGQKRGEKNI